MKRMELTIAMGLVALAVSRAAWGGQRALPTYAIKAGKIVTMRSIAEDSEAVEVINHGVVLISEGKIRVIGAARDIDVPESYGVIDASDRWVMPGIVEAHTHIGAEGRDLNVMV